MVMVTAAALITVVMMMVVLMVMMVLMSQFRQFLGQGYLTVHSLQQLSAGQFVPGGGNDGSVGIMLAQHFHGLVQLGLGNGIGTGQDNGSGGFHLVVIELTEVLHVDLHLAGIYHSHGVAQSHIVGGDLLHSTNDIGQLAHTGGFDDDAVRMVLVNNLGQSLTEVTHQAAADAAGIHFGDVDAGILQETAINADLTEFIFDQNQFLTCIGFLDHFLDQGRFTCSEESGVNVDFCHGYFSPYLYD